MSTLTIPNRADGQRLDRYLKKALPDVPYVAVQKMLRTGAIRVDGKRAKGELRLVAGMIVEVPSAKNHVPSEESKGNVYQLTRADRALVEDAVVYEDEALLILNKPAGLAAQAGSGHTRSLDRMVAAMWPDSPPKLTHRLDMDTTGLIVLAKTRAAAQAVTAAFAAREVEKVYLALLVGGLKEEHGHIRAALSKQAHAHGSKAVVDADGDHAHTEWWKVWERDGLTLVRATPHTGRMNQLRAHFAHMGAPMVGDSKYGGEAAREAAMALRFPKALYLHAWKLVLPHPVTGKRLAVEALPPAYLTALGDMRQI